MEMVLSCADTCHTVKSYFQVVEHHEVFTVRIGFLPLPGLLTEDTYEVEKDLYDTA